MTTNLQSTRYFQHRFPKVEQYLHHRAPYLLVESISEISRDRIETEAVVGTETFYSAGHFPGAPVLPGALMQEVTTQSAGILIAAEYNPMESFDTSDPGVNEFALGVLVRVNHAKYRGFARPGDRLKVIVELTDQLANCFEFRGRVLKGETAIMDNGFQLANILSSTLVGENGEG
ncbi:3-hydroxyacyl-ACP dehydratase FabZ family protein [Rhodopirellula sp. MGV]|uniref:3-hydroxyacyl-ACP dehydratase FabZ family protein n=1 Tax=Rhodopirellula sp. MGV TaxID=2023130 RepID=UPI000B964E19|nr:hypothetical protein [Rhodopirellula sp. MGV]OYP34044.1 hypothetical protein CGZ80_16665 [Rhodopirellula sp. MGV]PNY38328.1 hypothetical protein C2E31_03185 [Rhodopirellula baltica]